jgi:hypothetical protein
MKSFNIMQLDKAKVAKRTVKIKKSFTLPWWFKIFAYLMYFVISVVSIFFIIMRGISYGDEACGKWLTSVIVSAGSSCLITQPLQVYFCSLRILFQILLGKSLNY